MSTVLFVCHANTCRSVMAHVLLEKMLRERAVEERVRVRSAGVGNVARDGIIHLAEDTITSTDLRRHRYLVKEADLILTMTESQRAAVASFEEATGRPLFTLREFAGDAGDIEDPVLQGEAKYRACRDEIQACLERSLYRLLAVLGRVG